MSSSQGLELPFWKPYADLVVGDNSFCSMPSAHFTYLQRSMIFRRSLRVHKLVTAKRIFSILALLRIMGTTIKRYSVIDFEERSLQKLRSLRRPSLPVRYVT